MSTTAPNVVRRDSPAPDASPLATARRRAQERQTAREAGRSVHAQRKAKALPKRSAAELREIVARGQELLHGSGIGADDEATAQQVAQWVAGEFGMSLAVACSMADAALPHLISQAAPWVDVLFLDTGYHFAETVGTRDRVAHEMNVNVVDVMPGLSVPEQDSEYGKDLFARDPASCCAMRKVEPLQRTLGEYEAWVTGVRREEAPTRANTPLVTWDEKNGLVKINAVAAWTTEDLQGYVDTHGVILNPLLNDGYPSIGCAPCTARVTPGADPRSGRWAGLDKTECGLHT